MRRRFSKFLVNHNISNILEFHQQLAAIFSLVTTQASLKDIGREKYAKRACIPVTVFQCSPSRRLESASEGSIELGGCEVGGKD
ncbi:hypothetical protein Y032_0248g104 [Ancylostoma ceylanicum]|uniref:Uncharacterized protein n=1 Tax=Ancylostoma ceylanicum TaxID=53326 RepID=A0A016SDG7_9BILA|nr:hypothetical protein Y032_0248g104 [Ancylostoma ceylanicum]